MAQSLNLPNKEDLDLHSINEKLSNLAILLNKNEIYNENEFKSWLNDFRKIYGDKHTDIRLYLTSAILYFIGYSFISKFILNLNTLSYKTPFFKNTIEIEEKIKIRHQNINIFDLNYFDPLLSLAKRVDLSQFNELLFEISNLIFNLSIEPEFLFDFLIQKIISPNIRHKSGEFFTPPFLVKQMVKKSYLFGDFIIDPCCGGGNFLIEVIKNIICQKKSVEEKKMAINRVYGYDINPLSIYISKINLLYLVKKLVPELRLNLFVLDSLFQTHQDITERFDLVIGNPPWYTYRDIESVDYQKKVKSLAEELELKPQPKNLLNLEMSTLFFVRSLKQLLKNNGKIFFVITKGVITGSHTSRFRNFNNLSDKKIWMFNRTIEKVFNIDFICLYGQKSKEVKIADEEIMAYYFNLDNLDNNVDYYKSLNLKIEKKEALVPYSVEKKAGKFFTKKLISKKAKRNLIPLKASYYKTLFHKGADLNPRNLIFVQYSEIEDHLAVINHDKRVFLRAKAPWDKEVFKDEIIETKYLFKVVKSTEIAKFLIFNHYDVFLPLNKDDLSFNYRELAENAKKFYEKINSLYLKYKKNTTKNKSLMENIDRWSKLINKRQKSQIKVVYNNSGSVLCSTVVLGDFLVTGDLSFYDTNNLNEAYYLSAILNSNLMTSQIKILKSSRHIFKLPFEIPIKKFDKNSPSHQKLSALGREAQLNAKLYSDEILRCNQNKISKIKLQNLLKVKLKTILTKIDQLLFVEFDLRKF